MGEDIISQLPDELLHHILSFIPIKKAVITSFLSSRWKNLCSTNPFLTLYLRHDQRYDSFLNFIDNRLVSQGPRHDLGIQRFHLKGYYTSDPVVKQYVDRWIELLAQREIKEMKLCFFDRKIYPQAILSAKSITVLHLSFGKLWDTRLSTDDVKLVSLKKLWLKHVEVSDFIIHRILSSSLDLEEISLKFCGGLTRMSIRDLNGLKRLKLKMMRKLRSVEIDAPSLVRFHYEIYYHSHCEVKFLNCLNLRGLSLNPLAYNQLSEEISTLDNLKYLKIQGFYVSEELLIISSSSLTSLICNYGNLSKVEINIPNLQYLKLRSKNIILVSLTAPPKEEAKLTFNIPKMGIEEYISLLNILRELSGSKKVTLIVNLPIKNELIPDEWKVHIASVEYLTQSRNLWRDANIRLLDFLYMIFPNLHNIELCNPYGTSTVLRSYTCEQAVDRDPVARNANKRQRFLRA